MKRKRRFLRRGPLTTVPVVVRARAPWLLRILGTSGVMVAVAAIAWMLSTRYPAFSAARTPIDGASLAQQLEELREENETLRLQVTASDHKETIEQSTRSGLLGQLKALSDENALLKEDLAFFQTLMTSGGAPADGITINRFRVRPESIPGEYRYQLLVAQARTRSKEFQGRLQFLVNVETEGRPEVLVLPGGGDAAKEFALNFKFYQRVDGVLRLPPGSKATKVQVRVLERGVESPRSTQTVVVS